jgi:hypothetical protein
MRRLLAVFALAALARAGDPVREALDREDHAGALALAEAALETRPGDGLLLYQRAMALVGLARERQREAGHAAAVDLLEGRLDHEVLAFAYGEACAWAGEEERGIAHLRASALPLGERIRPELDLLAHLRRYGEAAERAREAGRAGWPPEQVDDWAAWAAENAALQGRLEGRARRAGRVAAAAGALVLLLAALLFRFAPAAPPAPS